MCGVSIRLMIDLERYREIFGCWEDTEKRNRNPRSRECLLYTHAAVALPTFLPTFHTFQASALSCWYDMTLPWLEKTAAALRSSRLLRYIAFRVGLSTMSHKNPAKQMLVVPWFGEKDKSC
jgi:hypothetical protein